MKLCDINRTGVVCWSPCPDSTNVIACGSIAGSLEFDLSSKSRLEFFRISPTTLTAEAVGTLEAEEQFNQLTWSNVFSKDSETYSQGLLAGAKIDGRIGIWNPDQIIKGTGDGFVQNLDSHKAPVKGLDFNPELPHFLASASEDGQVTLWDLTKNEDYNIRNNYIQRHCQISCLAWNRKRNNILCTASREGTCVVWNAEKQGSMIVFENTQERRRYSCIAWNPEILTQLAVASEDDNGPVIEIWELRQAYEPVRVLRGHTKGILSLSWCPFDSNLLISSGKDGRSMIWNPNAGSCVGELPTTKSWTFGVHWANKPSFLCTSSYDSKVNIYSVQDPSIGRSAKETKGLIAPKWVQRTVGGCFGFGSKYVRLSNKVGENGEKSGIIQVYNVQSVGEDEGFLKQCQKLENALNEKQYEQFCLDKVLLQDDDKDVWKLLALFCRNDKPEVRRNKLLEFLGYNEQEIRKALSEFEIPMKEKKETEEEEVKEEVKEEEEVKGEDEKTEEEEGEGEKSEEKEGEEEEEKKEEEEIIEKKKDEVIDEDKVDSMIQEAMIVRDFSKVVEVCIKAGRFADAIIIANRYGKEPMRKQAELAYFETVKRTKMKTVFSIVQNDLEKLVSTSEVDRWRTILAILTTYCQSEAQFRGLSAQLGERLRKNEMSTPTLLCNIFSGNFELASQQWLDDLEKSTKRRNDALASFVEKVMIFRQTLTKFKKVGLTKELSARFREFAQILSDFGETRSALIFLNMVESERDSVLRHRIYYSLAKPFGPVPKPPFRKQPKQPKQQKQQKTVIPQQQPRRQPHQTQPTRSSGSRGSPNFPGSTNVMPPIMGQASSGSAKRPGFPKSSQQDMGMFQPMTQPTRKTKGGPVPKGGFGRPMYGDGTGQQTGGSGFPPPTNQQSTTTFPPIGGQTQPSPYTSPFLPTRRDPPPTRGGNQPPREQPPRETPPQSFEPPRQTSFSPPMFNTKKSSSSSIPLFGGGGGGGMGSSGTGQVSQPPISHTPPRMMSSHQSSPNPFSPRRTNTASPVLSNPTSLGSYESSRMTSSGTPVPTPQASEVYQEDPFPNTPMMDEKNRKKQQQESEVEEEERKTFGGDSGDRITEIDYDVSSTCPERNEKIIRDLIDFYNTVFCNPGSKHKGKKTQAKNITKGLYSFFFLLNRDKVDQKILIKYEELLGFARAKKQVKVRSCLRDISRDFYKETKKYFKMTKFLITFYLK